MIVKSNLDFSLQNIRFATVIIQTTIFWIKEFEEYKQPKYIKSDIDFFVNVFSTLIEKLRILEKEQECIAIIQQERLEYLSWQESSSIIFDLLEKCNYCKINAPIIISEKNKRRSSKRNYEAGGIKSADR